MHLGDFAIQHLGIVSRSDDTSASSHWREYHSSFAFDGDSFRGLAGFGGHRGLTPTRALMHRTCQIPFRMIGARFSRFPQIDSLARDITRSQQREYDLDVLRQALTLAFLFDQVPDRLNGQQRVVVIGDGFASMSSLILRSNAASQLVLVNLTKTLLVDLWFLRVLLGESFQSNVVLVENVEDIEAAASSPDVAVIAIQAKDHALLRHLTAGIAINIASMQEMDPATVADYFDDLRVIASRTDRRTAFYCCNRVEKRLPDGTFVKFVEYPWLHTDRLVVDGRCPWHQYYYTRRPPFYLPYDGPMQHRLAVL